MNRRLLLVGAAAQLTLFGAARASRNSRVAAILAPSSLGLRPVNDIEPGVWRAPQSLVNAGLLPALGVKTAVELPKPPYKTGADKGTRVRNGIAIRAYSHLIADEVQAALARGAFPVVIGGDCSILLGCLLGQRRAGGAGLIHMDAHADFYHPGNYDAASRLGSVAGMALAMAIGEGEPLVTKWDGIDGPLVDSADVVQFGERDSNAPDYDFHDIGKTAMTRISIEEIKQSGVAASIARTIARLETRGVGGAWLHVDLDILDDRVMPAVDSPGRPGLGFAELSHAMRLAVASGRIIGAAFTIYDPKIDPAGLYARPIVDCIAEGLQPILWGISPPANDR